MLRGKAIFITGGAGFIGSAFLRRCLSDNRVIAYDNLRRNSLKGAAFLEHPNLELVTGDVLDAGRLREAMPAETQVVVHCAAITGIETVTLQPVETMRVNMLGTVNVLEAASRLADCTRVVCLSTSEVFGRHALDATEDQEAVVACAGEPRWSYAVSKLAGEHLAIAYHRERGLPTTVLRPFNVYGPGQTGDGAMRSFIESALQDEPLVIHGDGNQTRAWCYVEDMVDALCLAVEHPGAAGETFNIGNREASLTIHELATTVRRVLHSRSEIRFAPKQSADVLVRIPSIEKARTTLGFEARVGLEEGIRRTAEHLQSRSAGVKAWGP